MRTFQKCEMFRLLILPQAHFRSHHNYSRTMVPSNVAKLVQHTARKSSIKVHTHMYTKPLDMADRFIVMAIGILAKGMQILQTYVLKNLGSILE